MDTYGVVHADVSAELPGLYPGGFAAGTKPSDAQVTSAITTADTIITLKVQDVTDAAPASTDKAAVLAKRYIIEWVKAQIMRVAFAGNDPTAVKAATDPYDTNAREAMKAIEELGAQAAGAGDPSSRVRTNDNSTSPRALFLEDSDLDRNTTHTNKRF